MKFDLKEINAQAEIFLRLLSSEEEPSLPYSEMQEFFVEGLKQEENPWGHFRFRPDRWYGRCRGCGDIVEFDNGRIRYCICVRPNETWEPVSQEDKDARVISTKRVRIGFRE